MSGSALTTFGLPPLNSSFASGSPKVLQTDSLPGSTLIGPIMYSKSSLFCYCLCYGCYAVVV